ncbi:FixH family protein [Dongia sp.]|uniref:FixH family protein n=1 Tax=Dongia sp. TaxID=1977262 RepID=UPI0035B3CBA0
MMPSSVVPQSNRPRTDRALWIPGLFVFGFLVVIAVNGILIVTAVSSFSGLETVGAYEKGLHYNQALAAAQANAETGWNAMPEVGAAAAGGGDVAARELLVAITDRAGAPVMGLKVEAYLVRPTNAGMDAAIALKDAGGGRYRADFTPQALGNWELRLQASRGDVTWQQVQRIFVK